MSRTVPLSEKKRLANQRNAQKSTGPKTPEGKARSAKNAITHGVFCQEIVLVKEDEPLFKALRREFIRDLKPQRHIELQMVDKIVECTWKQRRLRVSESTEHDLELRAHLKEKGQTWEQEMATNHNPDYCAPVAMTRMIEREHANLEHYTRLDQRLQNMIHRCLKELRTLQASAAETASLPESPFEETVDEVEYKWPTHWEKESAERSQASAESGSGTTTHASPSPLPSPFQGEGIKQNEPTEFRNYDGDTTCDPSWSLPNGAASFGDHPRGG